MKTIVPVALALSLAVAAPAFAGAHWPVVVVQDSPAVYAIGTGHDFPLDLAASPPQWFGTGFQLLVHGRLEEVSACHVVCYQAPGQAAWRMWPQIDIGPLGSADLHLSYHAFGPATTTLYPNADVAISTAVPMQHSVVITYTAPKPVIGTTLLLGNFMALRRGERLLVLGNPGGTWTGARPTATYFVYLGRVSDQPESMNPAADFPARVLPVALWMRGHGIEGMSGGPVIAPDGRVVGVFVAAGGGFGYAIPLDPEDGRPVGGVGVKAVGRAD